jgi:uncharacterized protein (TIGR02266 family)
MFKTASEEDYREGDVIIQEGSSGDWIYVVLSGTVEISKKIGGQKHVVAMLGPGEVFGELGFLGNITRTATARAVGEVSVGIIDRTFLDDEFNKLSPEFRAILVALVKRFKQMLDRTIEFSSRDKVRVKKTLSLTYEDKKAFVNAYTDNVSNGGLFIRTEKPLEQGEQFLLKLQLPDLSDPMKIDCEVMWARKEGKEAEDPNGMGVKFVEMTNRDNQILKQYLNS